MNRKVLDFDNELKLYFAKVAPVSTVHVYYVFTQLAPTVLDN